MNYLIIDEIIKSALIEDGVFDDITSKSICNDEQEARVDLIFKEAGILCGSHIFTRVFQIITGVEVEFYYKEGDKIEAMSQVARIQGKVANILSAERVALNLLQRTCGIATKTNNMVEALQGTGIKIADTRKTTPNLRYIEKYAVKIGGGMNHRYNLSDMAMIKDNHIQAGGGITKAVEAVRNNNPFVKKIEVECETLLEVEEALKAKVDIIMLDNMNYETMKKASDLINKQAIIEISGNIDLEKVEGLKDLNIDYFSSGALTHSVKALDISMKNLVLI